MNQEAIDLIMQHLKNTDETFDLIGEMILQIQNRLDKLENKE